METAAPQKVEVVLGPGGSGRPLDLRSRPAMAVAGVEVSDDSLFFEVLPFSAPVSVQSLRPLTAQETARLELPGTRQADAGFAVPGGGHNVRVLREQHHEIARLIASGVSNGEIAKILNISAGTVGKLRKSPAFQDLLHSYMAARDQAAVDLASRIKGIGALALDKIAQKLEGQPIEVLEIDELRKLTIDLLDRSGHGPVQKSVSLNAALTPEELRELRSQFAPRTMEISGNAGLRPAPAIEGPQSSGHQLSEPSSADASAEPGLPSGPVADQPVVSEPEP